MVLLARGASGPDSLGGEWFRFGYGSQLWLLSRLRFYSGGSGAMKWPCSPPNRSFFGRQGATRPACDGRCDGLDVTPCLPYRYPALLCCSTLLPAPAGERLAAKHAAQQRSRMTVNQVQERIERRKAYMEIDDQVGLG